MVVGLTFKVEVVLEPASLHKYDNGAVPVLPVALRVVFPPVQMVTGEPASAVGGMSTVTTTLSLSDPQELVTVTV